MTGVRYTGSSGLQGNRVQRQDGSTHLQGIVDQICDGSTQQPQLLLLSYGVQGQSRFGPCAKTPKSHCSPLGQFVTFLFLTFVLFLLFLLLSSSSFCFYSSSSSSFRPPLSASPPSLHPPFVLLFLLLSSSSFCFSSSSSSSWVLPS